MVSSFQETALWVLVTTRNETLVQDEIVRVDHLSDNDAKTLMHKAAELPLDERLPDAAIDLIHICGNMAMDLAFVSRWDMVRNRKAWSEACDKIRAQLEDDQEGGREGSNSRAKYRNAILRAGFEDLAVGTDDSRVPRLYMGLAVMPDGHAFTVSDASALLYDKKRGAEHEVAMERVTATLERWCILKFDEGLYVMHDAHMSFARESLRDREYLRRPMVKRWSEHISSLEFLVSMNRYTLSGLWSAVELVGGQGWGGIRPYEEALNTMDDSDPFCEKALAAAARFQGVQGDWNGKSRLMRRLRKIGKRASGRGVATSQTVDLECDELMRKYEEAMRWRHVDRETFASTLALVRSRLGDGERDKHVGLADGPARLTREDFVAAEKFYSDLKLEEEKLGQHDVRLAVTLHQLGLCVHQLRRYEEAEELFRRALDIERASLPRDDVLIGYTLDELGTCLGHLGEQKDAEEILRQALDTKQSYRGTDDLQVSRTLYELGVCVRQLGRYGEAEGWLTSALEIQVAQGEGLQVADTLHELGVCVGQQLGRQEESEVFLRRALWVKEVNLGKDDIQLGYTLYQLSKVVRQKGGMQEDADGFFKRALQIEEVNLLKKKDVVYVAKLFYKLYACVSYLGRRKEADVLCRRVMEIVREHKGSFDAAFVDGTLSACGTHAGAVQGNVYGACSAVIEG